MNDPQAVVVYRSEAERAVDQWLWQGDGRVALMLLAGAIICYAAWRFVFDKPKGK